ncbi:hypothetical protein LT706_12165 [Pseudomonas syringae pv. syringae]|uniref:hypothetical protein n=1 Tax=Pseudomonas syringae TaxID=317 RepID=UPI00200AD2EA|nr:hypothetical protein [Pseudomonas syringae]MCK9712278.1 hypothetical protein [Pseudomonas syringae pv. syringae]
MYFTFTRPDLLGAMQTFGRGLAVALGNHQAEQRAVLLVKTSKEIILTARYRKGLKWYLAPIEVGGVASLTLISAFFDDPDNPLAITTPLVPGDSLCAALAEMPDEFDICFLDEHNREQLSCRASASLSRFRSIIRDLPVLHEPYAPLMIEQAEEWFSMRTDADDRDAISISIGDELFPSNFVHFDLREDHHAFQGSSGFSTSELVRLEPGPYQERDIVFLLQRIFAPSKIILGPIKPSDNEELVDVAVLAHEVNFFLQVKDSPNTEEMIGRSLDRKRRVSLKQLTVGLSQLGGTLSTARRSPLQQLRLPNGANIQVDFSGKPMVGIVIVKELFTDMYVEYSERALAFMDKHQVPVVFFDYPELEVLTRRCETEAAFISACHALFRFAAENGEYPKLHF